jgi:hypothetical protein
VRRTWDPQAHPQWLAFEAEGQLQIRPAQHAIAHHLMHNPGAIAQLNMGEGKTRVILPMLALHWGDGRRVVRSSTACASVLSSIRLLALSACTDRPQLCTNMRVACTVMEVGLLAS